MHRFLTTCFLLLIYCANGQSQSLCICEEIVNNNTREIVVSTVSELNAALRNAYDNNGNTTIKVLTGKYILTSNLWYISDNMQNLLIIGSTDNRADVVIEGQGWSNSSVSHIFNIAAKNVTIANMTIGSVSSHPIQVHGEHDADNFTLQNVRVIDSGEQLLKVSSNDAMTQFADNGKVVCSEFEFTAGVAYQYYTGGIDAHVSRNWIVKNNVFKGIRSPNEGLSEHAIHFWRNSSGTVVEGNHISNCDRGIGFGLGNNPTNGHTRGAIKNNFVHTNRDVGIGLESSPNTKVYNNTVITENYANSIEYRFSNTRNVEIVNNLVDKLITSRENGSTSRITTNFIVSNKNVFRDAANYDYHLINQPTGIVDAGTVLSDVTVDADCENRFLGSGMDIGADEMDNGEGTTGDSDPCAQTPNNNKKLLQKSDFKYLGAFKLPTEEVNGSRFSYGGTAPVYNATNNSLMMVGHVYDQMVAEISIPELINSSSLQNLNQATFIQPFRDIMDGKLTTVHPEGAANGIHIGGLLLQDDILINSAFSYYDAGGDQLTSHFVSSSDLSITRESLGPYQVGAIGAGFVSGYMTSIPTDWQAELGGTALTGNCCLSIISRTSFGPAVAVFDPTDLGVINPVPTQQLLYYPAANPLAAWNSTNDLFNGTTQIKGLLFPKNTQSILFYGRHGVGEYCYGTGEDCGDPVSPHQGTHGYPYKYQVWAYDALDLVAVKNGNKQPWEIQPYATWELELPFSDDRKRIGGVAYNPAENLVYVVQQLRTDYDVVPVVHVFELNNTIDNSLNNPSNTFAGSDNQTQVFENYPWLSNLIDINNCSDSQVSVYQSGNYQFIEIQKDGKQKLYFEDGTFYCESMANYDCIVLYNLEKIIDFWTCTNSPCNGSRSSFDSKPISQGTNLIDHTSSAALRVFPNPSNGTFTIQFEAITESDQTIEIHDMTGRLIYQTVRSLSNMGNQSIDIDISNKGTGIYMIQLRTENLSVAKKIIVNRN